jgi:hypothetical protein
MAKERPSPHLEILTQWLKSGEGAVPESLQADASRARSALDARDATALGGLALEVQHAAVSLLAERRDVETLSALEQHTPHKEVRKSAGKALHLLRTKGVKVSEAPRSEGFRFHTVEGEEAKSYASLVDPEGDRMVWFGAHVKKLGRAAFQAVVNEANGLVLFQTFPQMTAKTRRRILDELFGKKIPIYEIDNTYARWLIEEGLRRNNAGTTQVPKEYYEAEPYMGPAEDLASDPHPVFALLMDKGAAGEPTSEELRQGKSLHDLEEVQSWQPLGEMLERLAKQVDEAAGGVLVLSEHQQNEQVQASIDRAVREYFEPPVRARWSRRLLDFAHYLAMQDRLGQARIAVAVAEDLVREGSDAAQNPYATELFRKYFAHRHEHNHEGEHDHDEEKKEDAPLIVTP